MNAPIKDAMVLATMTKAGKSSLEAVHATRRGAVNPIHAELLTVTNGARPLAFVAFSAAS